MYRNFRDYHTLQALEQWKQGPLDLHLSRYFKKLKSIGSSDRRFIGEQVYGLIRRQVLLDHLGAKTWEERLDLYQKNPSYDNLPDFVRAGIPEPIYAHLQHHYGDRAFEIARSVTSKAPTTVRANGLKITREALLSQIGGSPTSLAPQGIVFEERVQLMHTPQFKEGLFELQDEASQVIAGLAEVNVGDEVLDYCAGSGGKALAIAPLMQGKGQLYLHDIRLGSLAQAKLRLKKAGVQNGQIVPPDDRRLKLLKGRINWLFLDVPCSGSGAWRRCPEQVIRFSLADLPHFVQLQRDIFAKALTFLAKEGKIVYSTCSLFPEENEEQMAFFAKEHQLQVVKKVHILPSIGGMDGMFGAVFCALS
ncbi:MAG: RsmB/NOP family class I SAM-dependent RNA methyltransferase [Verrucomicrobia bacterium]|nr:RsmB/NOP family class I SAM-dependent RNA methyltransferase [Verrucomicrobiota bacterium]